MLSIEKETAEKVNDIHHSKGGTLRIATSTHLSFYVIPNILKAFQALYPHIDTHIIITDSNKLLELLENELADLIFTSEEIANEAYDTTELFKEKLVVALPANMVTAELTDYSIDYNDLISGNYGENKKISDMSLFKGIEFIYTPPNTNIHKKRKILFGKSDIAPYITSNAGRQQFNYNLMCSGFGALLTTDANIATMPKTPKCKYFVLNSSTSEQSFSVVLPKETNENISHIANKFIDTAKSIFSCNNPLSKLSY